MRDANCAIFVVDMTRPETLSNLKGWIQLFRDHQTESAIAIMLGNKVDLEDGIKLSEETLVEYAKKEGLNYESVSAKTGYGVTECFTKMVSSLSGSKKSDKLAEDECFELTERFFQKYEQLKSDSEQRTLGCCYI